MATNSIFLRYDKDKMNFMRALIFGASETPYAHGAFIFDIFFGENFPKEPPQVKLVTTGNALVRFNPNLYSCGKVCLSLLGTWRG
jgi:ubiquitin-protein ligase